MREGKVKYLASSSLVNLGRLFSVRAIDVVSISYNLVFSDRPHSNKRKFFTFLHKLMGKTSQLKMSIAQTDIDQSV